MGIVIEGQDRPETNNRTDRDTGKQNSSIGRRQTESAVMLASETKEAMLTPMGSEATGGE